MLDIVVLYKFHLKKFKGNILVLILIIAVVFASFSQNSIGIGIATPDPSALLEVSTTDKGFLLPRMRNTEMNAISSPSEGLMVYCLDCILEGIYVYDGKEFRYLIFFENIVKGLAISNLSIPRGSTSNISPTLTPTEATAVYSLIDPPAGVSISTDGTTVSIATDMPIGEHDITVKARGTGNYTGEAQTTFILNIPQIALTGFSIDDVSVTKGDTSFVIPSPTPSGATVDYELITNTEGVTIDGTTEETTINIAADMAYGEYRITVKAIGTGGYNGEIRATFKLMIVFKNDDFVIHFNDENFENEVKRSYGITTNDVTYGDVKNRTNLVVISKRITNMEEIKYFTSLRKLECYDNQLRSLDLSQNTRLTYLSCSNNQLTSLDISQNTGLTYLSCYSNQLTSLDLSQNTVLRELHCYKNQLDSLDISQNTRLTRLSCSNNQLTSLDLSQNTVLNILHCYKNKLTSLDVSQNTGLEQLYCHYNQLDSLDLSQNTGLEYLSCQKNQLTSLDLSQNTDLNNLNCIYNKLTSLDLRGMRGTQSLNFSDTIQTLKVHRNIMNHNIIRGLKRTLGSSVTISTYSASRGRTNYELICNDYDPRVWPGTCN